MQSVGIKEFKTHLARYLRVVREGEILLITDRGNAVAEVAAPSRVAPAAEENLRRMVEQGRLVQAKTDDPYDWGAYTPPGLGRQEIDLLLEAEREERLN